MMWSKYQFLKATFSIGYGSWLHLVNAFGECILVNAIWWMNTAENSYGSFDKPKKNVGSNEKEKPLYK